MKILKGIPVAAGLAKGMVCLYSNDEEGAVPHYNISEAHVPEEITRLKESIAKAVSGMKEAAKLSGNVMDKKAKEIFNVHIMMLSDAGLFAKISGMIREKKINAEHAVNDVFDGYINVYETKQAHFRELAQDFMDLKNQLISSFSGLSGHFECSEGERQAVVVASKRLTPYMLLNIPRENILAIVTKEGGYTTHATIIARSLGVPVIFDIDVGENLKCTDIAIVDGFSGKVIVSPDKKTGEYYSRKIRQYNERKLVCEIKSDVKPRTKNNVRVNLKLNVSTPLELDQIEGLNHDGIGLLRTEFLFLKRDHPPSEDEQTAMYEKTLRKADGKSVSARLLDIGSDKLPLFLTLPHQVNPDLEIKGARAVESFYDIYLDQAKALLRAAKFGGLRVLYPMVSDAGDIATFKKLFSDARSRLVREKKEFGEIIDGIMIETPSAAILADSLLKDVGFANIGSNDLLQYALAASRGNRLTEKRYHILHPSLLKLFEFVVKAGKMHGKEICLCGEVASFEEFYPVLLELGLRSFSVSVSGFSHIKCALLHLDIPGKPGFLEKFYSAGTKAEMDRLFQR